MKRRAFAAILAVIMLMSLIPTTVLANENDQTADVGENTYSGTVNETDEEDALVPLVAGDDVAVAEQGTKENPWDVSADGADNNVTAYVTTNDDGSTYTLTISGTGAMADDPANKKGWFNYASSISEIVVGEDITSIGSNLIRGCQNVTVRILGADTELCYENSGPTFNNGADITIILNQENKNYIMDEGVLFTADRETLIRYTSEAVSEYEVPSSVKTIAAKAFAQQSNLTGVSIPSSVTEIGNYAFQTCENLSELTIPDSVTTLGSYLLMNSGAKTLTLGNGVTALPQTAFEGSKNLETVYINSSIQSMGWRCFYNCGLTEIVFPADSSLSEIGKMAFSENTQLKSVTLPSSVTSLGESAFSGCSSLQSVTLNQGLTTISSYAFRYCDQLLEITIPSSVTSMGSQLKGFYKATMSSNLLNQAATWTGVLPYGLQSSETDLAGYTFSGWYDLDGTVYIGNNKTEITSEITVYAVYSGDISFEANGGEGTVSAVNSYYAPGLADGATIAISDKSSTLPSDGFTREGYMLSGWNTEADGSGTSYDLGATVNVTNQEIKTLYAQWTPNTYTINFSGGTEASGSTASVSATYDQPATLTTNGFTMADKNFAGWATEASATTATYSDGATVENLTTEANGTVTLYAVWTDKQVLTPDKSVQTKTYNGNPQKFTLDDSYTIAYKQNGTTVTDPINAGSYDVVISYAGDDTYAPYPETTISGGLVIIPATLTAPVLSDYTATATSITVTAPARPDGASEVQYSIDGGSTWQNSNKFSGLTAGTSYPVIARFVADTSGNYADSGNSTPLSVKTDAANDTPSPTPGNSGTSGGSHSSSGSSSSSATYAVTVDSTKNGTVAVSPKNAKPGATVTLTVTPKDGYELDDLTVTDKNGKSIKVVEGKNGKFTFTMPDSKVTVDATFAKIVAQPKVSFADISASAYYYDAVAWAVENGVTSGTTATTFSPNAPCTRAQAVTFLWRAAGSPAPKSSANPFTDIQPGAYYYDAVLWAVEQGITAGTTATTFNPDTTCTRAQIVTFLFRAGGADTTGANPFTDVADSAYYAGAVAWAVSNGITTGTTAATFSPSAPCTRAQIVTFLYRAEA